MIIRPTLYLCDWENLRIQSECGKIRARKTPNTDTFYAVLIRKKFFETMITKVKSIAIVYPS